VPALRRWLAGWTEVGRSGGSRWRWRGRGADGPRCGASVDESACHHRHSAHTPDAASPVHTCTHTHTCTRTHTHAHAHARTHTHTHTHTRLTTLCPGLSRRAGTRKVEPIWILLEQETVSGSGIYWAICKSAPRSRQITAPAPHHSVFTGWMPFLPPIQQRQSTAWI